MLFIGRILRLDPRRAQSAPSLRRLCAGFVWVFIFSHSSRTALGQCSSRATFGPLSGRVLGFPSANPSILDRLNKVIGYIGGGGPLRMLLWRLMRGNLTPKESHLPCYTAPNLAVPISTSQSSFKFFCGAFLNAYQSGRVGFLRFSIKVWQPRVEKAVLNVNHQYLQRRIVAVT
jgi:hypothetical protein